jgi:hypothetical protein
MGEQKRIFHYSIVVWTLGISLAPPPCEFEDEFARGHGNEAELVGEAGEKGDDLVALDSLLALGEVKLVAIELGELFPFDDLNQETHQPVVEAQAEKEQM